MLQTAGADSLREALADSPRLASTLINARVAAFADRLETVEGQIYAARRAAQVIAAVPLASWPAHLTDLVARTSIAPDIALSEVLDADKARTMDTHVQSRTPLSDRLREWAGDEEMDASNLERPARKTAAETLADSMQAAQRVASSWGLAQLPASGPRHRL
jgi:hypothetical protein